MRGLILSGGKGTRLRPLTYTNAKQLIPVANKPVLFRVIEAIRDAGITDIGIVIGDTGEQVRSAVIESGLYDALNIQFIEQEAPLGLAHAVKISRDFLGDERFVMFLGDNVIQGGISPLIRDFDNHPEWNCQIVLKAVQDARQYGVAKLAPNGQVEYLVEKPAEPPSNLALVGIYMFDHHIFTAIDNIQPSARGELEITHAIQWLIDNGYVVHSHEHKGWWIDTGKAPDMLEANSHVLDELNHVILGTVDERSQVDSRVTIEEGAQIINSVIRGPAIIGKNTRIVNSYVGPYTSIYHHCTIEDTELERCVVLEHSSIRRIPYRLQDSLIGRHVDMDIADRRPLSNKLTLGDYSKVRLLDLKVIIE
ncbi:MAG: glucose-1-phosphate thymidylyltransferase [Phototrophicales bacterium]|nr:MAG: glucose-1-phosphate thymidylyltransferase [Phototrophicales bacterium]